MNDLISVIVPIYNVEKYLNKCLDSILNQTYQNLEVILINDGSPDKCSEICDEYAIKDARIRVVHKKNEGLSAARNSGIEIAKGEYIAFVDSDDYIHKEMYQILFKNMTKYDSDISICGFKYVYSDLEESNESELENDKEIISVYSGREAIGNIYTVNNISTVVSWNKLYKRTLFSNLRFKVGTKHEDEFLIHRILSISNRVVYSNVKLYYYLQRDSSIMGKEYNISRLYVLDALEDRMVYFKENGYNEFYPLAFKSYMQYLLINFFLIKEFYPKEKKIAKDLKGKFLKLYRAKYDVGLSKKEKMIYGLFCFSPFLYKMIISNRM